MTAAVLLTPWYRRAGRPIGSDVTGSTRATAILDHGSDGIRELLTEARAEAGPGADATALLAAAHALIRDRVRPVYSVRERRPASATLRSGRGSCSQRLAILEAVARAARIPTRVRGLVLDRRFWFPRFPRLRHVLPDQVVLAWPEFLVDGGWRGAAELFGPVGCRGGDGFANTGAETLFEAAGRCAVDWDGRAAGRYDLSRFVLADHGRFADRDELFARLGETLCLPSRTLLDPVLRRIAA